MMKRFGRALKRAGVDFILISGQASVLYGASTFSEDIDIWVDPRPANWRALIRALQEVGARVHKLTPPLQPAFARRGHGFHFVIPAERDFPAYLDVIGLPPRVPNFRVCRARSQTMDCGWGRFHVISIEDLILLKQTRRRTDYEVISRLVRLKVSEDTADAEPEESLLRWALSSTFSGEDIMWLLRRWPLARKVAASLARPALRHLRPLLRRKQIPPKSPTRALTKALEAEIARRQRADARYWSPIIAELRNLRRSGKLLPEGLAVGL